MDAKTLEKGNELQSECERLKVNIDRLKAALARESECIWFSSICIRSKFATEAMQKELAASKKDLKEAEEGFKNF